jgi:[protein-PII] uridylyltransferase
MNKEWRESPLNRKLFIEIIQEPKGITRTLQLMNQTSVLGRYLPPFRKIVGQMQHDLFHVYTVDQHILTVLKNVRRFFIPELSHEFPFCSQLAANFDKPWLLVLGALFHDIAKGRGGDHSDLGKKDVRIFAKQHGLATEDAELVSFLVAEHLSMSQIAQKQDISDPDVVKAFALKVKDEKHLTALYLLTVADIRGTSPKVWNAWKGKLLEDLYRITLKFLGGARYDAHSQLEQCQQKAQEILRLHGLRIDAHIELWRQIDIGFFLKHDADDIAWVTRHLFNQTHTEKPIVCARISPIGEGLQVFVYTPDQGDLFARICAYFDRSKFNILDANIHTTKHHYALDTFQISYLEGTEIAAYRDLIQMIEYDLSEIITKNSPLPEAFKGRISRQSRTFPVQPLVSLVPDERGDSFILSLSASDRVGLLYGVSKVLVKHQISLKSARINTLGERVEDTLLLEGDKLKLNPKLQIQLETELFEVLSI